jgi:FMN reductase
MYLVISSSLNAKSRSRVLAHAAYEHLVELGATVTFVDLNEFHLPACDASSCYENEEVARLTRQISAARGIALATPVYNYNVSASAKNLIELTGRAWTNKVAGFLCAAGGTGSYMALMGLANSLMLDFHVVILPRFVYSTGRHFDDENRIQDQELRERLQTFAKELLHFGQALANPM